MTDRPIFSVVHATARPAQWRASYDAWWAACEHPETVEYILAVDERWGFDPANPPEVNDRTRIVWCVGRKANVVAWNEGAVCARGKVIVANSDDMRPPQHWDTELLKVIPDLSAEFVVEVSSGPLADNRRLMVIYILSHTRYSALGYIVNPEYPTVYGDNEFGDHARQDGVVIDARHLQFHHHHPDQGDGLFERDAVYLAGNRREDAVAGKAIYNRRKAEGFPRVPKPYAPPAPIPPVLVSVITPSLPQRTAMLVEAHASVVAQTYPASSIEHLMELDSDRVGPSQIRNALVKQAKGEWLVFLDDDDLLDPSFTELHLAHAAATNADLVYSIPRLPSTYRKWRPRLAEFDDLLLLKGPNYIPMTVLLRRSMFDKVGGFRTPRPLEDYHLWIDLLKAGAKFEYLPLVTWSYRVHGQLQ